MRTVAPTRAQKDKRKAPKGFCANFRMGFKFREPKKWDHIALKVDEEWMGANYVSQKAYTYHDKEIGYTFNHQPELKVIVFPHAATKRKRVEKKEDGDEVTFTFQNPYKDYDDFLERTFSGGGFYEIEREEDEIDDVAVTKIRYAVEKGTQSGPKYIDTWIYHVEDADYAVQVIGLQNHWKEIERSVKQARKSFEFIERDGPLNTGAGEEITVSRLDFSEKKDKKEAESIAVKSEKYIHEEAINSLPAEGWDHFEKDRVLVVHSSDDKYAMRVARHTNGLFDWLDDNFGYIGEDAYVRKPVIRICKDLDEANEYTKGISSGDGGGGFDMDDELVTYWDTRGWTGGAIDWYNRNVFTYWLLEKNFSLSTSMPTWIRYGLSSLVENARLDTRKPDWRYDLNNVMALKNALNADNATPVKALFTMTSEEFQNRAKEQRDAYTSPWAEGALLINFLASPEVRRPKLARGLLESYLKNMIAVIEEIEEEKEKELDRLGKQFKGKDPRASEKDYRRARASLFKEMEKELLQRTFDRTFGDFSDKDWEDLTKDFHDAY